MSAERHKVYFSEVKLPFFVGLITAVLVCMLLFVRESVQDRVGDGLDISSLSAETRDGYIELTWRNTGREKGTGIELTVSANGFEDKVNLASYQDSYVFTEGVHGKLYTFTVRICMQDGSLSDGATGSAMFLYWDSLPDIPIVSITTVGGKEPGYVEAKAPEGCWGESITENEYVKGRLVLSKGDRLIVETGVEIKIRGNTSAYFDKKPYKIKLDNRIDLLQREKEIYKDREWILLSGGIYLNTLIGSYVSELCQLEWQPAYEFVNVIVNGDWKGCYYLIESVTRGTGRCNIGKEGYIIEHDVYWWNSEDIYFKTENQHKIFGYTFKYPNISSMPNEAADRIEEYLNDFERALYSEDSAYSEFIDVDSFVNWLLVHDILGSADGAGTNRYLFKYDFDMDDPRATKLKMGPAWDFDMAFQQEGMWASIHDSDMYYFARLLSFSDFKKRYVERWRDISPNLMHQITDFINVIDYGEALQESWNMDVERWDYTGFATPGFEEQVQTILEWFSTRVRWIDSALEAW